MSLPERNRAESVEQIAWGNGLWLTLTSWSLSLLYMATIFSLSAQSDLSLPFTVSGGGFFLHMVEYGILGLLLSWALVNSGMKRGLVFYVFLIGLFYGITDEFHQYFVPERIASLLDLTADGLGSFLGSYLFHTLRSIKSTM